MLDNSGCRERFARMRRIGPSKLVGATPVGA